MPRHPLVAGATAVADAVLAPNAELTDRAPRIPASNLAALADAGLFGLAGPPRGDEPAVTRTDGRLVNEVLGGACGATAFTWVQHHALVRGLCVTENADLRQRWLEPLCEGRALAGVAFAYLRRPAAVGPSAVRARRASGDRWVVSGEAPWVTSWGMADVFAVSARDDDTDTVVTFVVDPVSPALDATPLELSVMNATCTVRLRFDDLVVRADDVVALTPDARWRADDRVATSMPQPLAIGVAARAVRLLSDRDPAAAATLGDELDECRRRSYDLASQPDPPLDELCDLRAWSLDLAHRAALALLVASSGGGIVTSHPAQRLVREAAFYTVQAQTPPVRDGVLRRLTRP